MPVRCARADRRNAATNRLRSSTLVASTMFGWQPVQPGLVADLDKGHYFG